METATNITRMVMWNIPSWFEVAMYLLFCVSVSIFLYSLYLKYREVAAGRKPLELAKELTQDGLNWRRLIGILCFQQKVLRSRWIGILHALIFYGFIILLIATHIVMIHYDTPFKIFHGPVYILTSWFSDIGGLMILFGVTFAWFRRYVQKPDYLSATKPLREYVLYLMLVILVLTGYALEGIRIWGSGMPIGEKIWSPVGWYCASFLEHGFFRAPTLLLTHQILWMFHTVLTMTFVASICFTKFIHFLIAPFSAFITPEHRGSILKPMNLEDENAESFGLGKIAELTSKNRLDALACIECGRCTNVCPALAAGKELDPKAIITKVRNFAFASKNLTSSLWEPPLYASHELDACTTCGACMEECPMSVEHVPLIMELKRYKVLTMGEILPAAADVSKKITNNSNPWGIASADRFLWAKDLGLPQAKEGVPVDYLFFIGCAGSYDQANQKVIKDTAALLTRAGVSFAFIGESETCCGDPLRRFGDEYTFTQIAEQNIANIKRFSFKKIVTICPHCLHTIGSEYQKMTDGNFETIHHTTLLAQLLKNGQLKPLRPVKISSTFHDPCYLGRHHGEYRAPRKILNSIPGIKLKEMKKRGDKSVCCGMGGGNMWYELPQGHHLVDNRLEDVIKTKTQTLATACTYCMINFNSNKGLKPVTENIIVEDVASLLAKSVL
jgi:Fe-S oxidoreductase/nitrate reductase gamma subunit